MEDKKFSPAFEEFMKSLKPGQFAQPSLKVYTKQDHYNLLAPTSGEYLLNLFNLSNRDFIVGAVGFVEELLTNLLRAFVISESEKTLFGEADKPGKVKDFELKIELAFALGLITREDKTFINIARGVRNRFAHDHKLAFLEHDPKVVGFCQSIPVKSEGGPTPNLSIGQRLFFMLVGLVSTLEKKSSAITDKRTLLQG